MRCKNRNKLSILINQYRIFLGQNTRLLILDIVIKKIEKESKFSRSLLKPVFY
jgi:hypothetical protein